MDQFSPDEQRRHTFASLLPPGADRVPGAIVRAWTRETGLAERAAPGALADLWDAADADKRGSLAEDEFVRFSASLEAAAAPATQSEWDAVAARAVTERHGAFEMHFLCAQREAGVVMNMVSKISLPASAAWLALQQGHRAGTAQGLLSCGQGTADDVAPPPPWPPNRWLSGSFAEIRGRVEQARPEHMPSNLFGEIRVQA